MLRDIQNIGKEILTPLRQILRTNTVIERCLFFGGLVLFILIGTGFVATVDYQVRDGLLGYDTWAYFIQFQEPGWLPVIIFRHPFLKYILSPFILCNYALQFLFNAQVVAWFMTLFFNVVMAACVLMVYKLLHDIIKISRIRALVLTFLFVSFGHVLVISSQLETFSLSMLLLLVTLYVAGRNVEMKEPVNDRLYTFLFLLTSGVTLTNGIKVGLSYFFMPVPTGRKIKWSLCCALWFISLFAACFFLLKLFYIILGFGATYNLYEEAFTETVKWIVNTDVYTFLTAVYHNILCEPLMLHTSDFLNCDPGINNGYMLILQHLVVIVFYFLVVCGAFLSRKSRYTYLLLSFILVDALIHIVFRFGFAEAQIFSGHWMFIFPLLIAGIYKDERLKKYYPFLTGLLILLGCCFFINNIFRLVQFMVGLKSLSFSF